MLAHHVQMFCPRYSYRFLFIPGTIRSLTRLARNEDQVGSIAHGLVLSCLGDACGTTYNRAAAATRRLTVSSLMCCITMSSPIVSRRSSPTVTTSGSIARPVSICPSAV
jgi:aminopeptidase-like protein